MPSSVHISPFVLTPCYSWSHLFSVSYYALFSPCPLIPCSFFFTMKSADSPTNAISHSSCYPIDTFPVHLQTPSLTSEFPSRDPLVGLILYSFTQDTICTPNASFTMKSNNLSLRVRPTSLSSFPEYHLFVCYDKDSLLLLILNAHTVSAHGISVQSASAP